jgi:uncharacterized protein
MQISKLTKESILPLTCSRAGTCCFGKTIFINPWELACFSKEKNITTREFRDLYCEFGGIQLRFNGASDNKGQAACSQYKAGVGCTAYQGRPLACRLYPLGRQIQFDKAAYIYQGDQFPCLNDCAEVLELPKMTVGEYIKGQETNLFEQAQDEYLIMMQNMANIGFELLLETGLAQSGDTKTLTTWRLIGNETPEQVAKRIGKDWLDSLTLPEILLDTENSISFIQQHNELLLSKAQEQFGNVQSMQALHQASVLIIAVALHLAKSLGADSKGIAAHWIETAKSFGAQE